MYPGGTDLKDRDPRCLLALIDIGYSDAGKRIDEIESLLYSDSGRN
jgi:hypothetical protein